MRNDETTPIALEHKAFRACQFRAIEKIHRAVERLIETESRDMDIGRASDEPFAHSNLATVRELLYLFGDEAVAGLTRL
jgi:hypothetical protein